MTEFRTFRGHFQIIDFKVSVLRSISLKFQKLWWFSEQVAKSLFS